VHSRDGEAKPARLCDRRPVGRRVERPLLAHGASLDKPAAGRQAALSDGRRLCGRFGGLRGPRRRHVRLRLSDANGAIWLGARSMFVTKVAHISVSHHYDLCIVSRVVVVVCAAGQLVLKSKEFQNDPNPIDADCPCFVCKNFTRGYLYNVVKEQVGCQLLTIHNVAYQLRLMKDIRYKRMFLVPPPSTSITFIVRIARDEQRFDYRRQSGDVRAAVLLAAVSDARISAMDDRRPASGRHSALAMK
jgi:hypothetical protein